VRLFLGGRTGHDAPPSPQRHGPHHSPPQVLPLRRATYRQLFQSSPLPGASRSNHGVVFLRPELSKIVGASLMICVRTPFFSCPGMSSRLPPLWNGKRPFFSTIGTTIAAVPSASFLGVGRFLFSGGGSASPFPFFQKIRSRAPGDSLGGCPRKQPPSRALATPSVFAGPTDLCPPLHRSSSVLPCVDCAVFTLLLERPL